jgi:hypothetical protein
MAKPPYRKIIEKHLGLSAQKGFWAKETKLLKVLLEKYPDAGFWTKTEFRPKLQSFAQLLAFPLDEHLRCKYRDFYFVSPKDKEVKLNKNKSGKDIVDNIKPKSIRSFLNG